MIKNEEHGINGSESSKSLATLVIIQGGCKSNEANRY